jgi:hypothetical protein
MAYDPVGDPKRQERAEGYNTHVENDKKVIAH